jgi:hypothetical protein
MLSDTTQQQFNANTRLVEYLQPQQIWGEMASVLKNESEGSLLSNLHQFISELSKFALKHLVVYR